MAGFIDVAVQDIDKRLAELEEEKKRLLAARSALAGATATRRAPGKPARRNSAASATRRKPGRPRGRRGGNTRSAEALELVRRQPGITIPAIAAAMKIEPNYLYRVMPKLTSDGLVSREGQGWHPVAQKSGS